MTSEAVSLREHIEARLAAHDALHEQHEAAHTREHKATEQAILKAEQSTAVALTRAQEVMTEKFSATNEWRSAMLDREREFMPRSEYQTAHDALKARLDTLEDSNIARTTRETERERSQTRTMAFVGLAATVAGFLLSLMSRLLGIG